MVGKEKTASDGSYLSVRVRAVDACECRYTGGNGGMGEAADGHCRRLQVQRERERFLSDEAGDDEVTDKGG